MALLFWICNFIFKLKANICSFSSFFLFFFLSVICYEKVPVERNDIYDIKGVILTVPGSVWFGSVRNCSDFDASGSLNRKRVYGSVRDQSEPSSWAGSLRFNMA